MPAASPPRADAARAGERCDAEEHRAAGAARSVPLRCVGCVAAVGADHAGDIDALRHESDAATAVAARLAGAGAVAAAAAERHRGPWVAEWTMRAAAADAAVRTTGAGEVPGQDVADGQRARAARTAAAVAEVAAAGHVDRRPGRDGDVVRRDREPAFVGRARLEVRQHRAAFEHQVPHDERPRQREARGAAQQQIGVEVEHRVERVEAERATVAAAEPAVIDDELALAAAFEEDGAGRGLRAIGVGAGPGAHAQRIEGAAGVLERDAPAAAVGALRPGCAARRSAAVGGDETRARQRAGRDVERAARATAAVSLRGRESVAAVGADRAVGDERVDDDARATTAVAARLTGARAVAAARAERDRGERIAVGRVRERTGAKPAMRAAGELPRAAGLHVAQRSRAAAATRATRRAVAVVAASGHIDRRAGVDLEPVGGERQARLEVVRRLQVRHHRFVLEAHDAGLERRDQHEPSRAAQGEVADDRRRARRGRAEREVVEACRAIVVVDDEQRRRVADVEPHRAGCRLAYRVRRARIRGDVIGIERGRARLDRDAAAGAGTAGAVGVRPGCAAVDLHHAGAGERVGGDPHRTARAAAPVLLVVLAPRLAVGAHGAVDHQRRGAHPDPTAAVATGLACTGAVVAALAEGNRRAPAAVRRVARPMKPPWAPPDCGLRGTCTLPGP